MKKYTFIADFRGGIYVSQVRSASVKDAVKLWANDLDVKVIKHFGEISKRELLQEIEQDDSYPVLLTGMTNVWCHGFNMKTGFLLANIVAS